MSVTAANAAGSTQVGYEVANALGRLNSDRPLLGERCTEAVPIAKAIRFMIHAIDLHAQATGHGPERIARDVRRGRIELRLEGGRAKVVTP